MAARFIGPSKPSHLFRHELSKQLQNIQIDVALSSEAPLKLHDRFYIQNDHFHQTDLYPGRK
jgi:hypothetical protein